jgi:hypothetical protein
MSYAENTKVPVERSKAEIEKLLDRYGATGFGYAVEEKRAAVTFKTADRLVRFNLPLPNRPESGARAKLVTEYEQQTRAKWRALVLVIKAKLEGIESGITTFDEAFLAHIVITNGETVGDWARAELDQIYSGKQAPRLMPPGGSTVR